MNIHLSRREFIAGSLLFAGHLLAGGRLSFAEPVDDSEVKAVELKIRYVTEIQKPPKRKGIRIWIPLPVNDPGQEITDLSLESRLPYRITEDPVYGNRMAYMETERVEGGERFVMSFRIKRKAVGVVQDDTDPSRDLKPSEWERWDKGITEFVDRLVGDESDPVKIGRMLYDAIIDRMNYIHEVCGRGVSTITFEERLGRCDEFHALFRTMMMYRGIPVRWEQGMSLPYPSEIKETGEFEADCINARSWARFHIGEGRWMPVDLSEAKRRPHLRDYYFGRLVPNRMRFSTGRGLTLNPPQKGIINTFAYTYIEAGGIPVIYGHNYRNVINYGLVRIEK